jgi:hypothetical protein
MPGLAFDDILAALAAAPPRTDALARLRDWPGSIPDPGTCLTAEHDLYRINSLHPSNCAGQNRPSVIYFLH